MISGNIWVLRKALRKVWVRVVGYALLAVLSAVLAQVLSPYLPEAAAVRLGADAVEQILNVLASSMLAVTTFSLSIAVSAFAAAASTATPRATALLQEDRTTQNVLATFLGAFLFGLLGLIALNAKLYDASGRIVLFIMTAVVLGLVVVALIRWIDHLMNFGRMEFTLDRVEAAASSALRRRLDNPYLGGKPLIGETPSGCVAVVSDVTGYVQHIDMQVLQDCATATGMKFFVRRLPGALVSVDSALLVSQGPTLSAPQIATVRSAFSIDKARVFDEDPRFGLIVLSEIASRALSPAVNDPGTAIGVLGRLERVMAEWRQNGVPQVRFPDVSVPPVKPGDAVIDAFRPIARDGAGLIEVQTRLHKALAALSALSPAIYAAPAAAMSDYALTLAEAADLPEAELHDLRALRRQVGRVPEQPTASA